MPESPAAQLLLERASGDWSIFATLWSDYTERQRRELLRFHRERSITDEVQISMREAVDSALDRVCTLELGLEIGLLTETDAALGDIPHLKELLSDSPAFVRYADNYLSLSLRFVADRLHVEQPAVDPRMNRLPVARPAPPPVDVAACRSEEAARHFVDNDPIFSDPDVAAALAFLDDFSLTPNAGSEETEPRGRGMGGTAAHDQTLFALWLGGLTDWPQDHPPFLSIARGIALYAQRKSMFYLELERHQLRSEFGRYEGPLAVAHLHTWANDAPARGAFLARNPITARFGQYDLYWFARILRAEVSPTGTVTYADGSWLDLLASRAEELSLPIGAAVLRSCEDLFRAVLDYACDLVQNAVEIVSDEVNAAASPGRPAAPASTWGWRRAFDEELQEIGQQRQERLGWQDRPPDAGPAPNAAIDHISTRPGRVGWSRRIITGDHQGELVGLAISGGGIRSATFGLGILQHLQELDLLRKVDYLSTVSGGGYIGSWLVGNVHRTRYWLTQPTEWRASISHLRRYSIYLAPRTGLLSADTWTMWGSWLRNTLLIQLTAVAWLGLVMAVVTLAGVAFAWQPSPATPTYTTLLAGAICVGIVGLTFIVDWNLKQQQRSFADTSVQLGIVVPALVGAGLSAMVLWAQRTPAPTSFGTILLEGFALWPLPLVCLAASYFVLSLRSIEELAAVKRAGLAALSAALALAGTYLVTCGVYWTFCNFGRPEVTAVWCAFAFGPSLMLLAPTAGVGLMIGVLGLDSKDWRREWWTRLGSWLGIYVAGSLLVGVTAIFGPWLLLNVFSSSQALSWKTAAPVLGWLGTVIGGLLAGNSSSSDGDSAKSLKARALSAFARVAAVLFIAGALLLVATLAHVVFYNMSADGAVAGGSAYWTNLHDLDPLVVALCGLGLGLMGVIASLRFDLNIFGLNQFYRNRLVRCYLGATRWQPGTRKPHRFTAFDADDDIPLSELRHNTSNPPAFRGPFPILNGALNLGGSPDLDVHTRRSASFVMTPLRCGADRPTVGYAPTRYGDETFAGGVTLGQAVSISGAAASPNMGYDTSPLVSFLLTMFNVRLAWWFPNPGSGNWTSDRLGSGIRYLVRETFGLASETSPFVNVSDGGHFENLGIYELVRRRCTVIIASDGECDNELTFGSLGRVIRMCRTDFNAHIDIDVASIRRAKESRSSRAHCAVGRITYANGSRGYLIYLKASLSGDEDVDVQQYHASHQEFPHESTGDQFFTEDQFESYRKLGQHIAAVTFRGAEDCANVTAMASKLANIWVADNTTSGEFVERTQALSALWTRMSANPGLGHLFRELHALPPHPMQTTMRNLDDERIVCLELLQLVENTYLQLRLDEHWTHPDNRGWVELFTMWARSQAFRDVWRQYQGVFGIRFGYFCRQRLGLS